MSDAVYVVTYEHPDGDGWSRPLLAHVHWLQDRLGDGTLLASGPMPDSDNRRAMLCVVADDWPGVEALVATDPFAVEGLIVNLMIARWGPIFGAFNGHSSRPAQLQTR